MNRRHDLAATENAARAVERVLRAERDADAAVDAARRDAQALLATARDESLAIVNRALERVGRWQRSHGAALQQRLDAQRAQAEAAARVRPDDAALRAAVERVAAHLTGGTAEPGDGGAR